MLSSKFRRHLIKILPFGFIPFVFSIIYSLLEKGILGDHPYYPSTGNPYSFNLIIPAIVSLILGLFIGIFEVFYLSKVFLKTSFAKKIVFKTTTYFLIIIVAILLISILSASYELKISPFDIKVWNNTVNFFSNFALWSIVFYFILGLICCLFYIEIVDNVGQYVLLNFFTGKYHQPLEEERVFMFLDMKSSTAIAEKLGHIKYFNLLKDYYSDLSDSIIEYAGEIYQYVGDEVVVTWKLKRNNINANSIHCFFAMQNSLIGKTEKYLSKYGIVPTFKAGIHLGKVTTGEIGKIKKDFVFTGDILNTTARIQGLCNKYNVKLLLSKKLVDTLNIKTIFNTVELGETELRGKDEKVTLYSIEGVKHN